MYKVRKIVAVGMGYCYAEVLRLHEGWDGTRLVAGSCRYGAREQS